MFRKLLLAVFVLLVLGVASCAVVATVRGDERFFVVAGLFGVPALPVLLLYLFVAARTAMQQWESGMKKAADSLDAEFSLKATPDFKQLISPFSVAKLSGVRFDHVIIACHQGCALYAATLSYTASSTMSSSGSGMQTVTRMFPLIVLPNVAGAMPDFRLTPRTILSGLIRDRDYQELTIEGSLDRDRFAKLFVLQASAGDDVSPVQDLVFGPLLECTERLRGWSLEARDGALLAYREPTFRLGLVHMAESVEKRVFREVMETLEIALDVANCFSKTLCQESPITPKGACQP
jgi:hypothetical protein